MAQGIDRIGPRSWEELSTLLQEGYFVSGEQRITPDSLPGSTREDVRLWDNWQERRFHVGANTLGVLVTIAQIPIEEWGWIPCEPVPQQTELWKEGVS